MPTENATSRANQGESRYGHNNRNACMGNRNRAVRNQAGEADMTEEPTERIARELQRIRELMEEKAEREAEKRRKKREQPRLGDSHNEIRRRWGTGP
jgi:hypothetical protein